MTTLRLAVLLLLLPALASTAAAEKPTLHRDLVYGMPGQPRHTLDLIVPSGDTPPPLIVWIHGGGWRTGSKARNRLGWMAKEGFAVASINYRLSQHAVWPAQIHDCKAAIRWLRANARQYGYDASRIGVGGSSAGGHLVAMLGTSGDVAALEGAIGGHAGVSSRVQAVYDLFGPAEMVSLGMGRASGAVSRLLGGAVEDVEATAVQASPVTFVSRDDAPFLIAHGGVDRLVPVQQSRDLHARLVKAGVPSTLRVFKQAGHGGPAFNAPEHRAEVFAFFRTHLVTSQLLAHNSRPGPHAVDVLKHTVLHDAARKKDLQVRVTWPNTRGSLPVIVWSHGAYGSKDVYAPLVQHWASHGYVVIQATHSDSLKLGFKGGLERLFRHFADRPQDVRFLLDSLVTLRGRLQGFEGSLDAGRIGVGGHSFGAHTSQLIGGATTVDARGTRASHADSRVKAVLLVSPQGRGGELDKQSFETLDRPTMVVTGTLDGGRKQRPYTWRLEPFTFAPPGAKTVVLIEGARHSFGGITGQRATRRTGPAVKEHVDAVKATSLLFWDAYLRASLPAQAVLTSSALETQTRGAVRTAHK